MDFTEVPVDYRTPESDLMISFFSKTKFPPPYDFSKKSDSKTSPNIQEEKERYETRKIVYNLIGLFVIFAVSTIFIWYLSKKVDEHGMSSYCSDQLKNSVKEYKEVSVGLFFIYKSYSLEDHQSEKICHRISRYR